MKFYIHKFFKKRQPSLLLFDWNMLALILIPLCLGTLLIILSYYYLDLRIAHFVYEQQWFKISILKKLVYIPTIIVFIIPFIYLLYVIRFISHKITYFDQALLAMANSTVIAIFLKDFLKVIFGRYSVKSLLTTGHYGFYFLHGSSESAFPSGHAIITFAALISLWLSLPKFRLIYFVIALIMTFDLLGLNAHFLSDIIAAAILAWIIGYSTARISRII